MSDVLQELLDSRPWLLADGATGTNLFSRGLQSGDAPELWNSDYPDRVLSHYESFIEAGADIVLTNSFGGTRYRLALHKAQDRVYELNSKAAQILRQAVDQSGRTIVVAGSMGPTGEILQPVGSLSIEDAEQAFEEQAEGLKAGGVDVIWIETMSSKEEVKAAVTGAAKVGLPIVTCVSIDTNGKTMMGVSPQEVVQFQAELNPTPLGCGANCGLGAAEVVGAIVHMNEANERADQKTVLVAKANCGIPEYIDGKIVYNGTPELMAEYAKMAYSAGAKIIGGCCGTTTEHLIAMRGALENIDKEPIPSVDDIVARLGEVTDGLRAQLTGQGGPLERVARRQRRRDRARRK